MGQKFSEEDFKVMPEVKGREGLKFYEWESLLKIDSPNFVAKPILSTEQPFENWAKTGRIFQFKDGQLTLVEKQVFRGKSLESGQWVEGNLVAMESDIGIDSLDVTSKVDENTVCQKVGLSGEQVIFEKDIVENKLGLVGVVEFSQHHMAFVVYYVGPKKRELLYESGRLTVIGNLIDDKGFLGGLCEG